MFRAPIHAGFAICIAIIAALIVTTGCSHHTTAKIPARNSPPAKIGSTETGVASWYGNPYHGRRTASGEIYDMEQLTAAHRSLPFQTWVEVTDLDNGKKVTVRITDRGPFVDGRIIDLSLAAAREIEMVGPGIARVKLKVVPAPRDLPIVQIAKREPQSSPIQPARPMQTPAREARTSPPVEVIKRDPPVVSPPPRPETAVAVFPKYESQTSTMESEPARVTSPPARDVYTVQAAAFADRDRAEAYSATLRSQFAELVDEARVISSPPVWKVLLGRELTLDAANELASRLKDAGATALVIRDL